MEEFVEILDEKGKPTGKTAPKAEAHRLGLFHPTIHVWFYQPPGQVLLQQRAKVKDTHPLLWDVSVAGHVHAGETIEAAAIREVKEEIGLDIHPDSLEKIGVFKSVHKHRADLVDCEFHHTFLSRLPVPLAALKKQETEVASLKMVPLLQFAEETWGLARPQKYVPHATSYYKAVIKAIKARL